jgi:hypothetical protein
MILNAQFGGVNTTAYLNRLPSGTADRAVNVTLINGELSKRAGFAAVSSDVNGSGNSVLNMFVAHFADGDVYLVCKCADGFLWAKKVYSTAGNFAKITTAQTHNAADPGFFFMWGDRLHYFDRGGGSRWNPDVNSGTAYKAGMPKPSTTPTGTAAASGGKFGLYYVYMACRNAATREIGAVSLPSAGIMTARIVTGAISASNWNTLKAADTTYEWDEAAWYSTKAMGSPNLLGIWWTAPANATIIGYKEMIVAKTDATVTLTKPDEALPTDDFFTNGGGEPPAALLGCYDGNRAVYGNIYVSSALVPSRIDFSIPGFPCMVPKEQAFTTGTVLTPRPWIGSITAGIPGALTALASGGGIIAAFTPDSTTELVSGSDGKLWPRTVHATAGCVAQKACVGTPGGIHAIGESSWLWIRPGVEPNKWDIANERIRSTLEAIPAAYRNLSVMGHYAYRKQVWAAVPKSGGTKAQRIVIYDYGRDEFSFFDPASLGVRATATLTSTGNNNDLLFTAENPGALGNGVSVQITTGATAGQEIVSVSGNAITIQVGAGTTTANQVITAYNLCGDACALASIANAPGNTGAGTIPAAIGSTTLSGGGSDAGITCFVEYCLPNAEPTMLMGTDDGHVLKYPSGYQDDGVEYGATWRGYYGQERINVTKRLKPIRTRPGASTANQVSLGLRSMRQADESVTQYCKPITKSQLTEGSLAEFNVIDGNLFQLEFFSPNTTANGWTIRDLTVEMDKA